MFFLLLFVRTPPNLEISSCLLDPRINPRDRGNIWNQVDVADFLHVLLDNPGYKTDRDIQGTGDVS